MYLAANLRVWILESLSDGRVGMILRNAAKASLRLWVRWRSRTLAKTRCDWTSWCCSWWGVGDALLPLELLDPWSIWLMPTDLMCRCWWSLRCLLLEGIPSLCWWLLLLTALSPLWSEPPESESNEFSERLFRLFWWWWWLWCRGERLLSWTCKWCITLSPKSWWPVLNGSVCDKIDTLMIELNEKNKFIFKKRTEKRHHVLLLVKKMLFFDERRQSVHNWEKLRSPIQNQIKNKSLTQWDNWEMS